MCADELQATETDAMICVHKHVLHAHASYATGFHLKWDATNVRLILLQMVSDGGAPL